MGASITNILSVVSDWVIISVVWFVSLILSAMLGAVARPYLLQLRRLPGRILKRIPRWFRGAAKAGATELSRHSEQLSGDTAIMRELRAYNETNEDAADDMEWNNAFDFSVAEAQLERAYSLGFKKFCKPPVTYDNIPSNMTPEITNIYANLARSFFTSPVELKTDSANLFDDEEGAIIVKLFKRSDCPIFFAMDKFRRVVGDNAKNLVLKFSAIVLLTILTGVSINMIWKPDFLLFANVAAGVLVLAIVSVSSVWIFGIYTKARDSGMSDFSGLLERYLAGVSDKFHQANTRMSQAILGEEDDHEVLAENADQWHRIMIWMGLRTFFIECFLRNINFQMRRNIGFYELFALIVLLVFPIIGSLLSLFFVEAWSFENTRAFLSVWLVAGSVFGLVFYVFTTKKEINAALNQKDWRGFESLQMDEKMRELIGKYAQEAAIGKRRGVIRPGGGGGR